MDGVKGVSSLNGETTMLYAEFKLEAHAQAKGLDDDVWQRFNEDGSATFLLTDAAELTTVKADLDRLGITYDPETNVALTAQQKAWLDVSGITSRSQVDKALERAQRIDGAADLDGLKTELLRDSMSRR